MRRARKPSANHIDAKTVATAPIPEVPPLGRPIRSTRTPNRSHVDSGWARATAAQYNAMATNLNATADDDTTRAIRILSQCNISVPAVPISPHLAAAVTAVTLTQGRANAILAACDVDALLTSYRNPDGTFDPIHLGYACATGDIDLDGTALRYKKLSDTAHPDHLKWQEAHHHELLKLIDVRKNMHFIHYSEKPAGAPVTYYYNPR